MRRHKDSGRHSQMKMPHHGALFMIYPTKFTLIQRLVACHPKLVNRFSCSRFRLTTKIRICHPNHRTLLDATRAPAPTLQSLNHFMWLSSVTPQKNIHLLSSTSNHLGIRQRRNPIRKYLIASELVITKHQMLSGRFEKMARFSRVVG